MGKGPLLTLAILGPEAAAVAANGRTRHLDSLRPNCQPGWAGYTAEAVEEDLSGVPLSATATLISPDSPVPILSFDANLLLCCYSEAEPQYETAQQFIKTCRAKT